MWLQMNSRLFSLVNNQFEDGRIISILRVDLEKPNQLTTNRGGLATSMVDLGVATPLFVVK